MPFASEEREVVLSSGASLQLRVSNGNQRIGDVIGAAGINKPNVTGRKHSGNGAPSRCDNREIMGEGFDEGERLAFVRMRGGKTKHIGFGEQCVLRLIIGETHMANDTSAQS